MPKYKSLDEMPAGLRKLFDEQFVRTEDGNIVERPNPKRIVRTEVPETVAPEPIKVNNRMIVQVPEQKVQSSIIQDPMPFIPHSAMNVGADEIALSNLNKTETRYLEILRSRPENIWIGVHVFRLRIAANTHYTPDFAALDTEGVFTFYDSKGGWTFEDAQLKMKLVARMFPFFRWVKAELILATKKRDESLKETTFRA